MLRKVNATRSLACAIFSALVVGAAPTLALADRHDDRRGYDRGERYERAADVSRWREHDRDRHDLGGGRHVRDREHDRTDFHVGIRIGDGGLCEPPRVEHRETRVWVEPVYRTVVDRVWVEPVYRSSYDRVWIEPVYRDECERVWIPERWELRECVSYDACGRRIVTRERVLVEPGRWIERPRRVLVCEGRWETVERRELVCEGHWKTIERPELVSPGHWETRVDRVVVDDGGYRRDPGFGLGVRFSSR